MGRGFCNRHYQRWRKTGAVDQPLRTADDETRFWAKVRKPSRAGDGTCWLWTAGISSEDYGNYFMDGRTRRAHRVAYEFAIGPIPEGMTLDHLADICGNRACVKVLPDRFGPAHLELVTLAENIARIRLTPAMIEGRRAAGRKGAAKRWGLSLPEQPE